MKLQKKIYKILFLKYEKELALNRFSLIPPDLFLEKIDQLNFRNRNIYFTEFFSQILSKVCQEMSYESKSDLFSLQSKYVNKHQYILKKIKSTFASAAIKRQTEKVAEPIILSQEVQQIEKDYLLEDFDFEEEIKSFFEKLLKTDLTTKASSIVANVFKEFKLQEFDKAMGLEKVVVSKNVSQNSEEKIMKIPFLKILKKDADLPKIVKNSSLTSSNQKKRGRPKKEISEKKNDDRVFSDTEKNPMEIENEDQNNWGKRTFSKTAEKNQKKRKIPSENDDFIDFLKNN